MQKTRDIQFDSSTRPLSTGKVLRIGVTRNGKQAAAIWKFWSQGAEVYATSRFGGISAKISVHSSEQIHMRTGARDLQHFAPAIVMGDGSWLHAFELRFLLSKDTYLPPAERLKKNEKAFLLQVPDNAFAVLNLIFGNDKVTNPEILPHELLPNAFGVWRCQIRDPLYSPYECLI
jgi:hypothetical protein